MRDKIEKVLDEIRPMLQADGGDVELVQVSEDGIVQVHLQGACADCPGALMTLRQGIQMLLMEQVPGVREVVAV